MIVQGELFFYNILEMKLDSDEELEHEHKNPVKRAEREREFKTAGNNKAVFTEAKDMHAALQQY